METKKTTSKKLKTIAVLSAITICSSVGISSIEANAGVWSTLRSWMSCCFSSSNKTNISGSSNNGSRLKSTGWKSNLPRVELVNPFKKIFTSSSSSKNKSGLSGSTNQGFSGSSSDLSERVNKPLPPTPTGDDGRPKVPFNPNKPLPPTPVESAPIYSAIVRNANTGAKETIRFNFGDEPGNDPRITVVRGGGTEYDVFYSDIRIINTSGNTNNPQGPSRRLSTFSNDDNDPTSTSHYAILNFKE